MEGKEKPKEKDKDKDKEKDKKNKSLFNRKIRKVELLGQGSYGNVYKVAFEDKPNVFYALKKLFLRNPVEGFDVSALKEITILKELNNDHIEKILDMFYSINSLEVALLYLFNENKEGSKALLL